MTSADGGNSDGSESETFALNDPAAPGGVEPDSKRPTRPVWGSGVLDPTGAFCALCATPGVSRDLLVGSFPRDPWVWTSQMSLCSTCALLLAEGRDADLAERVHDDEGEHRYEPDPVARVRHLRQRVESTRDTPPAHPEVTALIGSEFKPLEDHTGAVDDLAPLWPGEHRRSIPDFRPEVDWFSDKLIWFVRSPWPALSVDDVLTALWFWAERDDVMPNQPAWTTRINEVFGWTETESLEALRRAEADIETWPIGDE